MPRPALRGRGSWRSPLRQELPRGSPSLPARKGQKVALASEDISRGEGVCVVDPHGELVEELLSKIPKERKDDVIYFNPADDEYHVGFNILELGS